MTQVTVTQLATMVGGRLVGDGKATIVGLGDVRTAGPDRVGFIRDKRYRAAAENTRVGAVLVGSELRSPVPQIVVGDVDVAYAKIASHFHPTPRATEHTVHPSAVVDPRAELVAPVQIGPNAVVGRCRIGAGTIVMAGAVIGDDAVVGRDCVLFPHAVLHERVVLGDRVILQSSSVIGSEGFGYARDGTTWIRVPQLGTVHVGDDVEIGAGSAVDRGTLGQTTIGPRTKIDNLCHIAHNCTIGADVVMAANVGIAGSTSIGDRCVLAGSVGISGHLKIAADVRLGGGSVVLRDVPEPGDYMGNPLMEKRRFLRLLRLQRQQVEDRQPNGEAPADGRDG